MRNVLLSMLLLLLPLLLVLPKKLVLLVVDSVSAKGYHCV